MGVFQNFSCYVLKQIQGEIFRGFSKMKTGENATGCLTFSLLLRRRDEKGGDLY